MIDIGLLTADEIQRHVTNLKFPSFRAAQIFSWIQKGVTSFDEMTNVPRILRLQLAETFEFRPIAIEAKQVSGIDGTIKYLFRLYDGECIESVLMQYKHGVTICISTQAGCRMGCTFCATGLSGLTRNLTASEMMAQIHMAARDQHIHISNVVLMGMGEPLDNFENVIRFLDLVSQSGGLNISLRRISLSTCGLVDKILELMHLQLQLTLSVSLHAPNDTIRNKLMPINRKWNVNALLSACRQYTKATSRRISFEYAMISGLNDSDECAGQLAQKLKGMLAHVNIIPANPVEGNGYQKSEKQRTERFAAILNQKGINATVRRTLGADIDASCGQLRGKINKQK